MDEGAAMKLVFATMIRPVAGAGCRSATWNATSCDYYAPNPDSTHHQPPTNSTPAAGKRPPHDQQATDLGHRGLDAPSWLHWLCNPSRTTSVALSGGVRDDDLEFCEAICQNDSAVLEIGDPPS
jgi:hypothetical protein